MLKPFCDVCKKSIEDDSFIELEVPLNGTGQCVWVGLPEDLPDNFHVHQSCVFDSIRAAERRINEAPVVER